MTVVETIESISSAQSTYIGFALHTITLSWEDRRLGHGRRKSDSGLEFAISLPSGTILTDGNTFVLCEEKVFVTVREALEPVYVVRPRTRQEWAYYAYQAGNRHQPVMIGDSELVFLQSPAIRSLLDQLRVPYSPETRSFNGALANIGHTHQ